MSRRLEAIEVRLAAAMGVAAVLACGGDPRGSAAGGAAGEPAAATSSLVATPTTAPSTGGAPIALSVTVRDALGNAVPGASVTFSATGTNSVAQPGVTDATGVATAAITSAQPGTKTVTVTAGTALLASANVTFTAAATGGGKCSDGSSFPSGGFVIGVPPVRVAANWSPNVFTGAAGSLFVPDDSIFEHNDPAEPLTGGGHDWVFDQGSTLCKVTDTGPGGAVATGWAIPPNGPTDCVVLPIIKGGRVTNIGDVPYQGDVITPTCDPALLSRAGAPNPKNTYFNQLGCAISHGAATTPRTATSYLFVAGIKGGLFSIPLANVTNPVVGGNAGKVPGPQNYYSAIPEGQKLTNAIVSRDGQFAIATSLRRQQTVFACLNPLGDPGDPSLPIDPSFFVPPASTVRCMQVGNNALQVDLTDAFGPDNQPYFGGQRVVNAFAGVPGGTSPAAWPQCIWQNNGSTSLLDAFVNKRQNGCGNAQPNFAFSSGNIVQPQAIITHGQYMYVTPVGGTLVQYKVTQDPSSGFSQYQFRTYVTGLSIATGLGVADDLQSLMVFTDPSAIGAAGQGVVTRLPLCEDM